MTLPTNFVVALQQRGKQQQGLNVGQTMASPAIVEPHMSWGANPS